MPATQRGEVKKLGGGLWAYRYYDKAGCRRQVGGFRTKGAAGDALELALNPPPQRLELTIAEAIDRYLAEHDVDEATVAKLRRQLKHARTAFADRLLSDVAADELGAWRKTLSEGSRHDVFRAFKQVLERAARWTWIAENPARYVKNPKPKRPELRPFASWDEVEAVADELDPRFRAIPLFAYGTGLRPEEWIALERRDVDRRDAAVYVRRVYTQRRLKHYGKTDRAWRRVPLRRRVVELLGELPPRLDTPLLFRAPRGGHIELERFRSRHWAPAVRLPAWRHDVCTTFATASRVRRLRPA
jgi:integrase